MFYEEEGYPTHSLSDELGQMSHLIDAFSFWYNFMAMFILLIISWDAAHLELRGQVSPLPALARVGGSLVVEDAGHRHHDHLG